MVLITEGFGGLLDRLIGCGSIPLLEKRTRSQKWPEGRQDCWEE